MTGGRRGIVTGGTWCVDYNRVVSHWPGEDGLAELFGEERHGGGSGCNLAIDIRKLDPGMPVETIAMVGRDDAGHYLQSVAEEAGIDARQMVVTDEVATQFCDAFVSKASHRRTHIFHAGAAALLTPDHFNFEETTGRFLHLGLPGVHRILDAAWQDDQNGWVTVLKKARRAGLKTNLELASVEKTLMANLTTPCLPHLDFIIVNDTEIGAIAGIQTVVGDVTNIAACERAARIVLEKGAMDLVAVHCPRIAIVVTRAGVVTRKSSVAIPSDEVVGANGAGDAFAAGMLYGLHEGWSIEDTLGLAHAVAAVSLRSISTTGAMETWRDCLALAARWGWSAEPAASA